MSNKTSPSEGFTPEPADDLGEIHNWTELLYFFNHSLPECELDLSEDAKSVVLFVLYLAIFVVGLVENLLVIFAHWRCCSGRSGFLRLYILNMAIADLGVLLTLPVWMLEVTVDYTWLWGSFSCRFAHYFYFVNMYSSIFFLLCLSVDRYITLTQTSSSWQSSQHRVRRAVCACVWVLSAILPLPEVAHIQLLEVTDPMCLFTAPFESYSVGTLLISLSTTILGFLLPLPFIAIFNVLTARRLWQTGRPQGRRHCLLVSAYTVVFIICWLPYHVTLLLFTLLGTHISLHCYVVHLLYFFYDVVDCFTLLHCVINPILYNFLSRNFRSQLLSAVVHYLPKVQARARRHASSSSSSSTQHSIIITKEGIQPTAASPQSLQSLNTQASNISPLSASPSLPISEAES